MKNIEAITILLASLQQVEADIKQINSFADQTANDKCMVQLNMRLLNVTEREAEENKVSIDNDGDFYFEGINRMMFGYMPGVGPIVYAKPNKKDKAVKEFKQDLNEIATLKVLGVLLEVKLMERTVIVEELKSLNIQIS